MLTIFTIPRPFKGLFDITQRNAVKSWTLLRPKCEIILFGDEEGTAKAANDFNVIHIPDIEKSEFGTPLYSYVFSKTRKIGKNDILAYVNTDIILMDDFLKAIERVRMIKPAPFLMVGQRWNLDINESLHFSEGDWQKKLRAKIVNKGNLLGPSGMDYWVFPKNLPIDYPAFTIGRVVSDGWLIYKARLQKIPVIDATKAITAVHQNHDYPQKKKSSYKLEVKRNIALAGGLKNVLTLRDADWILTREGLKKPSFPRRIFAELSLFYPWRYLLSIKRRLQQFKNGNF